MLNELQSSIDNSKRYEERGIRSVELFLALFTALSGGIIAIIATIEDTLLRLLLLSFVLAAIAGISAITYIWLLHSSIGIQEERLVRYYLYKFFYDLDPYTAEEYGRGRIVRGYAGMVRNMSKFDSARSISLFALILFSSLSLCCSIYTGWLAIAGKTDGWGVGFVAISSILWAALLLIMYNRALANLDERRVAGKR
jgi:hypothetical protein